ncbi:MAG: phosphate ABC transporter permease subunit PstC [Gaiellaceae bacterium]
MRPGDFSFRALTTLAAATVVVLVVMIAYEVLRQAWPAIQHFGISFVWTDVWNPIKGEFGAWQFIVGTVVSSFFAILLATPLSIAIALFLTELAPKWLSGPVATLVELLAAIPSVVLGLWGILVLGPVLESTIEPWLQKWFGWLQIFSGQPSPVGMLNAILILTIMIIPIVSAITRELFLRVPKELKEGALGLGTTRWEAIRGVVIPYCAPGIVAAVILGIGRAVGEAIAVAQVSGNGTTIQRSFFAPTNTLAAKIANSYQGASTKLEGDSLLYLALILLILALFVNGAAQVVIRRAEKRGVL